jgi:acyl-CoA oxidase
MTKAAAQAGTPRVGKALANLAALYGMQQVMSESGWLTGSGLLPDGYAEAGADAIDALCDEIAPDALLLADGFGITNEVLRAPIASADYAEGIFNSLGQPYPFPGQETHDRC